MAKLKVVLGVALAACLAAGSLVAANASERERGDGTMDRVLTAEKNRQKFFGESASPLAGTDPELAAMRDRLFFGEIVERGSLTDRQRTLVVLTALVAGQMLDEVKAHTEAALRVGVSPEEIREAVYQCAPYTGFPRAESALRRVNEVFAEKGVALPLKSGATTTEETRFRDGVAVQKAIFGDAIDKMHAAASEDKKDITVNYLSAFCFGDIYTRAGLDLKMRELLTFSIISTLGGCEAQVKAHVQGNASVGNTRQNLVDALALLLPYIGFPRTLNALGCVDAVLQDS